MNRALSKYQNIKFLTGGITRESVLDNLATDGYCIFRGTNIHQDIFSDDDDVMMSSTQHLQSCLFGENFPQKMMNYAMGTDSRDKQRNKSLLSVSKISSGHWVPYHNELLYTNEFPRIVAFICVKAPEVGGQTPICNTIEFGVTTQLEFPLTSQLTVESVECHCANSFRTYYQLPKMMRSKFDKYGIKYVRSLVKPHWDSTISHNFCQFTISYVVVVSARPRSAGQVHGTKYSQQPFGFGLSHSHILHCSNNLDIQSCEVGVIRRYR